MTKIKILAFILFTILITSCSTDTGEDKNNEYFNFTYGNKEQKVKNWQAGKIGDFMEVMGVSEEGIVIDFKFNIYGNLYESSTYSFLVSSSIPYLKASENFTANTFTFTLEKINTTDKTVQVKYSGKVYDDEYNYYDSEFVDVNGSFKVTYNEIAPTVEGLGTYAKIDGKDWHGLSFGKSINNWETTILWVENDGEYTIGIALPYDDAKTGTFTFANNNAANRIEFYKYDVTTHQDIEYDVAGTVTYSIINNVYVAGTFSLTATHPVTKAKIVISNGTFIEGI